MKTVVGIVILGLAVTGVLILNQKARDKDGKSMLNVAGALEVPVEVASPERRDIVRTVQAPGEVEAFAEVGISSEVVGKILEMPVEEGDQVQEGDLLCRLDDALYRAQVLSREANVAKLKAAITQARADLERAQRDWEQQERLRGTNATSPMEEANYHSALVSAQAMLEMRQQELVEAEAVLQSAQEDLRKTVIRAPLSGVVAQRFAKQGEVVITGTMNNPGTRIMVITDLSRMQVRCRIDEADAAQVAAEQPARIYLQSDTRRSIAGSVLRVGTKGTKPQGRDVVTFETLVLITGADARVKPGMTANVEIEVARRDDALAVPVQAVVYRKRRDVPAELLQQLDMPTEPAAPGSRQAQAEYLRLVFCAVDGKAKPHLVQTGINDATHVEISSGLAVEDTIITGPYRSLDQLQLGSALKVPPKPASPAPAVAGADARPAETAATTSAPTSAPSQTDSSDEAASAAAPTSAPSDAAQASAGSRP